MRKCAQPLIRLNVSKKEIPNPVHRVVRNTTSLSAHSTKRQANEANYRYGVIYCSIYYVGRTRQAFIRRSASLMEDEGHSGKTTAAPTSESVLNPHPNDHIWHSC